MNEPNKSSKFIWFKWNLAGVYIAQCRFEEAERLYFEMMQMEEWKKMIREDENRYASFLRNLARLYRRQGRYDEAERTLIKVLELSPNGFWPGVKCALATIYAHQGRYDEAEDHPDCFDSMHELAMLHKEQTRYEKAEKFLLEALEGRRMKLGDTHPHTLESWKNLIELYEAWGKPEKAEEWRAKLPKTEAVDE